MWAACLIALLRHVLWAWTTLCMQVAGLFIWRRAGALTGRQDPAHHAWRSTRRRPGSARAPARLPYGAQEAAGGAAMPPQARWAAAQCRCSRWPECLHSRSHTSGPRLFPPSMIMSLEGRTCTLLHFSTPAYLPVWEQGSLRQGRHIHDEMEAHEATRGSTCDGKAGAAVGALGAAHP